MTPAKTKEMMKERHHNTRYKEERQKLVSISVSIRMRKARSEFHQGKNTVEIRGKLADTNNHKAAHSLSTKKCGLFCH